MKSNKIVQFPMEGFDPSAFLTKQSTSESSSTSASDCGVTTVNVKSSEEQGTEEETGKKRDQTSRQGSEVSQSLLRACQMCMTKSLFTYMHFI